MTLLDEFLLNAPLRHSDRVAVAVSSIEDRPSRCSGHGGLTDDRVKRS